MPKSTAKGRDVLGRIELRRREIVDVIVTAVILGFTLNILADYIMSFDTYSDDVVYGKTVLAAVMVIVTISLLVWLVLRDMEDMSRIDMERTIHLFWNIDTGQPLRVNDAFWVQGRFYYAINKWVTDLVKESTINALRHILIPKETLSYLTPEQSKVLFPYFNVALFIALMGASVSGPDDYGISEVEKISISQILDVPDLQYSPLANAKLKLRGRVSFTRKRIGDKRVIEFQWHKGYSGRLTITCGPERCGMVYWSMDAVDVNWWNIEKLSEILDQKMASRTAYATFKVTFEGNFNRMRLFLNSGHTKELRAWSADFFSNIGDRLSR